MSIQPVNQRKALRFCLIDDVAQRAPVMANRLQSLLKRVFAWAVDRDIIEASPLAGIKPPVKETSRDRVLEDQELAAVWRACEGLGWAFGPITQLMILTAARRSEAAGLKWAELDLERAISGDEVSEPSGVDLAAVRGNRLEGLAQIDRFATGQTIWKIYG